MNGTMIRTTILTLAALAACAAASAAAGDLPAQEQRIWAPTGDPVGLDNHATASFQALDPHGDEPKAAEDWQLLGKYSGSLLLGWHRVANSGYRTDVNAYGTNEQGGLTGRLGARGSKPGHARWSLGFRNADHYGDRDSEQRASAFTYPPAPPALVVMPHLEWRLADVGLGYRLGNGLGLSVDFSRMCREGTKASLLRSVPALGPVGPEVPGTKAFDTTRNEVRLGADYATGRLAADLGFAFRTIDGDRILDTRQVHEDDQQAWRVQLNAGYDLGARTRLLGGVAAANLKNGGGETRAVATAADGETRTTSGRLGVVTRLGRATTVSVSGLAHKLETDATQDDGTVLLHAVERERMRQELRAEVANTSLPRTRLQLKYRYRVIDHEETIAEGDLPFGPAATRMQAVEQDGTSHDLAFRARHRLSSRALVRARVVWQDLELTELTGGDAWYWTMGDRERERLAWELALQTRPARSLKLDLGWRGFDQTFTRTDEGTETGWQANTLFAGLNWNAHARAVLYGTVSYGSEQVELTGVGAPTGTMGPVAYDGTTLRFLPGASVRVRDGLWLDGMYEGVRFEDTADESAALDALQADHDRLLVRARWEVRPDRTVTVTYRRHEFDENRWDDYIQDLWQVSLSGTF